jgi:hypothetical protein
MPLIRQGVPLASPAYITATMGADRQPEGALFTEREPVGMDDSVSPTCW